MTREQAMNELKLAQESDDTESAHADADKALCLLLRALGYDDVVDEWQKVKKWYS